jgi:hypothetical protein
MVDNFRGSTTPSVEVPSSGLIAGGNPRIFSRTGKSGTRYWSIARTESAVIQICSGDSPDNLGVESTLLIQGKGHTGSKRYRSPEFLAEREALRRISLKMQQGFHELHKDEPETILEFDFNQYFPEILKTPKPIETIAAALLKELDESGRARYTVKYDGIGLITVHHSFGWEIYTLNGNRITEQFPLHREALRQTPFQVGTLLKGEGVIFTGTTPWARDFILMNARFGPGTGVESTRAMIASGECQEPTIVFYDCLYFNSNSQAMVPYRERYN